MESTNKYISDFKEMPLLLKVLFIFSIYSLITTILNFIQMRPINFAYFNSGFPKNYPFIWYLYLLLMNIFAIIVYLKRSYTILKKYLYLGIGILIIALLNSVYSIDKLSAEQRTGAIIVYAFTYFFTILITIYLFKQKKYFKNL